MAGGSENLVVRSVLGKTNRSYRQQEKLRINAVESYFHATLRGKKSNSNLANQLTWIS